MVQFLVNGTLYKANYPLEEIANLLGKFPKKLDSLYNLLFVEGTTGQVKSTLISSSDEVLNILNRWQGLVEAEGHEFLDLIPILEEVDK